ncbi:winged helix-turn-helix domain-containing protein [Halorhabdus sp. CUG00001]|uniref:ArsR/SmtB family transcription factor n=1 Tax=Halorhabdus sp. CUG00001 TaxID=2600297 RepID=UPI00131CF1F3|nr:winged helix-turn-helix domain-containing protein [Halorhabdus sp. CUG00001]
MTGRHPRGRSGAGAATDAPGHQHCEQSSPDSASSGALLSLLGDTYARQILALLVEQPRTGQELGAATEMSRPTIYRRLERLVEHGLVRTEMQFDPDGHHRKQFHATVDGFEFSLGEDGIDSQARRPDADLPDDHQ